MAFKRFRTRFLVRIVFLIGTIFIAVYLIVNKDLYAIIMIGAFAVIAQAYSLLRLIERTNRDLTRFLDSIEYSDFSQNFRGGIKGRSFDELNNSFEKVMGRFREISLEKEESHRYLQTVVQHIGVGIVAYGQDGKVDLINTAAKRLFGITHLRNLESLDEVSPGLPYIVRQLKPGKRDLFTVTIDEELLQLSLYATELRQRTRMITLVSFQNISLELNEKEMDAWQNLIRVLTHEIKNSLAPIGSLASSVEEMLLPDDRVDSEITAPCDAEDISGALQTIQRRAHGLLQFVDTYRDLTHIPKPQYTTFPVSELVSNVEQFVIQKAGEKDVSLASLIEPSTMLLTADQQLIEQVLINLVINAIQANEGRNEARVSIEASIDDRSRAVIRVIDNGPGITGGDIEKVFVPFYSTKKDGSGIGLSLSRQIMRLHRGDLTVLSEPGIKTIFRMRF
ncbi:MAG: hypothetical protein KOO63_00055 [Bacteroidales bacterium]|nr:hypothetical protein [Candidatus Latescibacterota bacterium]